MARPPLLVINLTLLLFLKHPEGTDGMVYLGIATAIVMSFMFLALLTFVLIDRRLRRYRLLGRFWRADWRQIADFEDVGLQELTRAAVSPRFDWLAVVARRDPRESAR